uniref:Uncharacterized protein n=1 Tax=Tanacetum cinerariifolium TaxID=118510 RepID=A0A699S145_TANCI|nr:hypothetical protein [Tanacetum cinerariifolium]
MAAARVEITVSPAPVTSNTSRARAGRCSAGWSGRNSVMPCSPRVTSKAPSSSSAISCAPLATNSASSTQSRRGFRARRAKPGSVAAGHRRRARAQREDRLHQRLLRHPACGPCDLPRTGSRPRRSSDRRGQRRCLRQPPQGAGPSDQQRGPANGGSGGSGCGGLGHQLP